VTIRTRLDVDYYLNQVGADRYRRISQRAAALVNTSRGEPLH
jgi:hypothetical protein